MLSTPYYTPCTGKTCDYGSAPYMSGYDTEKQKKFTTRTEQVAICSEPLQKLLVSIGICKIDLSVTTTQVI